jgi:sulfopyruvate decarboxylase TPP-binding subunit
MTLSQKWEIHMSEVVSPAPAWQESIFQCLKLSGVRQVAYVPDAGHAHVIRRVQGDPQMRDIVLTTEEEGVALATGPGWVASAPCC